MNKDPFSYFRFEVSDNVAVQGTVSSMHNLFITVGVTGLLITILLIGMKLMSSNPAKRAEALEEIKWKALIAIILFGMTAVVSSILNVVGMFA